MKLKKVLSMLFIIVILISLKPSIYVFAGSEESVDHIEEFYLPYHTGYTLLKSGRLKSFADEKRIISEKIQADKNCIYYFKNLSAKYGNCFYVIYDSNDEVINYLGTTEESTGETIDEIRVIMPENASYFRLACDLNVNNKMFIAAKSETQLNVKKAEPAVISFTDDDCRSEVYSVLYPLIKKLDIPYTLACPPNSLDDNDGKYMTTEQLQEVYANGVDIMSHHLKEYAMTEFESIEDYEKDTELCLKKLDNIGIKVNGVAYPNGLINDEYMPVVKNNFKFGCTIDRAINTLPYESSYIHRCEVFPQSGIYNINDAKALVDSVAENGGWLVFMTHCWYKTFSADDLEELVNYIRSKNIEISNVTDVIKNYGNPIDIGIAKKTLNDMSEDYYIIDCRGRVYTNNPAMTSIIANNMKITEKSDIKWEEISFKYNIAVTLLTSGKEKNHYSEPEQLSEEEKISQKKRNVSNKIYVTPNSTYKLANLSAKYGNCFYVIYDSDNNVISYQGTPEASTGETLDEITIEMPSNASYLKMACDLNVNNKMFKIYHANFKGDNFKKITFDANGGKCVVKSTNIYDKIEIFPISTRDGYKFLGWYTQRSGGKQITTETIFETNSIVYAQWEHYHNLNIVPAKIATCEEIGNNEYYKCLECGKIFKDKEGIQETSIEKETLAKLCHIQNEAVRENEISSTCIQDGSYDEVVYCKICGKELSREHKNIAKNDKHIWNNGKQNSGDTTTLSKVTSKATLSKNGVMTTTTTTKCAVCVKVIDTKISKTPIYYPKSINLKSTSYIYDGKKKKPKAVVTDSNGKKVESSNYEISYSNNKKVGKATAKIKFKGSYEGIKKITYKIYPKETALSKVIAGKKSFKVKWKAQKLETTGYQIQIATDSKFTKNEKKVNVNNNKITSKIVTRLKAKKKYYVRIRTYKIVNGKKYYSSWSAKKIMKTKN